MIRIVPSRISFQRYFEEKYKGSFPYTFPFFFNRDTESLRIKISRLNILRIAIARV